MNPNPTPILTCQDTVKWSEILKPQNMGLFWFLTCLGETVSNLAAAKYGTISNFVVTWDLNFWVDETVSNFATAKYWTVSNFNLTCQNGLKFCICKIWDRFKFCHNMAKRSQIMWLQNMGPFQIVSWCAWIGLKFCSCKIRNHFIFDVTWWYSPIFCRCKIYRPIMCKTVCYYFMTNYFQRNFTLAIWLQNDLKFLSCKIRLSDLYTKVCQWGMIIFSYKGINTWAICDNNTKEKIKKIWKRHLTLNLVLK